MVLLWFKLESLFTTANPSLRIVKMIISYQKGHEHSAKGYNINLFIFLTTCLCDHNVMAIIYTMGHCRGIVHVSEVITNDNKKIQLWLLDHPLNDNGCNLSNMPSVIDDARFRARGLFSERNDGHELSKIVIYHFTCIYPCH